MSDECCGIVLRHTCPLTLSYELLPCGVEHRARECGMAHLVIYCIVFLKFLTKIPSELEAKESRATARSACDIAFCFLASAWPSRGLSTVRAALLVDPFVLPKLPAENCPAVFLTVFTDRVILK